jgi:hypothetical protein
MDRQGILAKNDTDLLVFSQRLQLLLQSRLRVAPKATSQWKLRSQYGFGVHGACDDDLVELHGSDLSPVCCASCIQHVAPVSVVVPSLANHKGDAVRPLGWKGFATPKGVSVAHSARCELAVHAVLANWRGCGGCHGYPSYPSSDLENNCLAG